MNMNSQEFLSAMGIQQWQTKSTLPGAKETDSLQIFRLFTENKAHVGYLLFDTNSTLISVDAAEISRLTQAMLAAIKVQAEKIDIALSSLSAERVMIFGKALAEKIAALAILNNIAIVTHHPAELLRQPSLKRQAWLDLQKFMQLK